MEILFPLCVMFGWAPSTGPVTQYEIEFKRAGSEVSQTYHSIEPQIEYCTPDLYEPTTITVIALGAEGNRSEPSGSLAVEWRWNLDFDKNGMVGFSDFSKWLTTITEDYQTCNDGTKRVPCP